MKRLKYLLIAGVSLLLTSCENFLRQTTRKFIVGRNFLDFGTGFENLECRYV